MNRFTQNLLCGLLLALLCATGASAYVEGISGEALWRYAEFTGRQGGRTVEEGSHFAQQYSLLYNSRGILKEGRLGQYDLGLGYEWSAFDTELNGQQIDRSTGKILFKGDVLISPGGVPFRAHIYSHDLYRSRFAEDSYFAKTFQFKNPGIISDIYNGQHVRSGVTLMAGVQNGTYLGRYRDVLSQFPRLFIDYSETYIRDVDNFTPEHYRDRNLAFVSLNKRDNWFHYTVREFTDFNDPTQDFREERYLIGTIDHFNRRQWINLTNWVKISTDISMTEGTAPGDKSLNRRYDVNLFATARRTNWNASMFPNYSRRYDMGDGFLERELDVPVFSTIELNRNTALKLRFIGNKSDDRYITGASLMPDNETSDIFAGARLEMLRMAPFTFATELEAERKTGTEGTGDMVRFRLESASNRRVKSKHSLFGRYSVARFAGQGRAGSDFEYVEQTLLGKVVTDMGRRMRTGFEQEFILGSGTMDRGVADHIYPQGDLPLGNSTLGTAGSLAGDTFRSRSTWFGEHTTARRISNRLALNYEFFSTVEGDYKAMTLTHDLRVPFRDLQYSMFNEVLTGDNISSGASLVTSSSGGVNIREGADLSLIHRSSLRYSPSRTFEVTGIAGYIWRDQGSATSTQMDFTQRFRYNFFTSGGMLRKYAEMREEFTYTRYSTLSGFENSGFTFRLAGSLYPTRYSLLGAGLRIDRDLPDDEDIFRLTTTAGLDFTKFQLSLDYSFTRTDKGNDPILAEHRWELMCRKIF